MASPHATHEEIAAARRALFPADEPWNGTRDILGSIIEHCALCPKQRAESCDHLNCAAERTKLDGDGITVSMRLRLGSREGVFLRTK